MKRDEVIKVLELNLEDCKARNYKMDVEALQIAIADVQRCQAIQKKVEEFIGIN